MIRAPAQGPLALAIAAHYAVRAPIEGARFDGARVLCEIRARVVDSELAAALDGVEAALAADHTPAELAALLGLARGVTGYVHHTVPLCLYTWLRSPRDVAERGRPLPLWWPAIPVRNALFTALVLATGLRRLLPPYGRRVKRLAPTARSS